MRRTIKAGDIFRDRLTTTKTKVIGTYKDRVAVVQKGDFAIILKKSLLTDRMYKVPKRKKKK